MAIPIARLSTTYMNNLCAVKQQLPLETKDEKIWGCFEILILVLVRTFKAGDFKAALNHDLVVKHNRETHN
jgi:hypothetical protein